MEWGLDNGMKEHLQQLENRCTRATTDIILLPRKGSATLRTEATQPFGNDLKGE